MSRPIDHRVLAITFYFVRVNTDACQSLGKGEHVAGEWAFPFRRLLAFSTALFTGAAYCLLPRCNNAADHRVS
jgi:hypothetical protein